MELDTANQQVSPTQNYTNSPVVNTPISKQKGFVLIVFGAVVILIAIAGGAYYLGTQKSTSQNTIITQNISPTSFPTTTPNPTANLKSYINSTHNFSFKYPADVFVYQGNAQKDEQFWSNKADGGSPLELGQDGVWFNMSFKTDNKNMMDFYNRIISMKPSETISKSAVTKLKDIDSDGIKGATYYQGVTANFSGEPAYTYEAVWIKNSMVYRLSLSAYTEQNLQNYKEIFEQIVSSFHFNLI